MKCRSLLLAAASASLASAAAPLAQAQNLIGVAITEPGQSAVTQHITLGVDKSTVIDLPRAVSDVIITNSSIADAVVQTRRRIIFRGVQVGETNAFLYDEHGNEILSLEIAVQRDMAGFEDLVARHVPTARVHAEALNDSIILTGAVANAAESEQVLQLAQLYAETTDIVNLMSVAATDQVLLEVRVVEMQRTYLKQLGLNPQADITISDDFDLSLGFNGAVTPDNGFDSNLDFRDLDATSTAQLTGSLNVAALERIGVARTLAEPTLTALSGELATFMAGGEFPIPMPADENGVVGIQFREFGVGLGFTPIVLSEDRISLRISTEVSELSAQGAVGGVPALTTRKVETTVELPSGQSMMLAGLIQTRTRQQIDQIPGIESVPVLGSLFQSRDFNNDETELVFIITPYLVDPTTREALRTPADGFANPSDAETLLFGRLNHQYGDGEGDISADSYRAPVGFIEE